MQALQGLAILAPAYGGAAVGAHAKSLGEALGRSLGSAPPAEICRRAAAVGACLAALCSAAAEPSSEPSSARVLSHLLSPTLGRCCAPPPAGAGAASAATVASALAGAGGATAAALLQCSVPILLARVDAPDPTQETPNGGTPHSEETLFLLSIMLRSVANLPANPLPDNPLPGKSGSPTAASPLPASASSSLVCLTRDALPSLDQAVREAILASAVRCIDAHNSAADTRHRAGAAVSVLCLVLRAPSSATQRALALDAISAAILAAASAASEDADAAERARRAAADVAELASVGGTTPVAHALDARVRQPLLGAFKLAGGAAKLALARALAELLGPTPEWRDGATALGACARARAEALLGAARDGGAAKSDPADEELALLAAACIDGLSRACGGGATGASPPPSEARELMAWLVASLYKLPASATPAALARLAPLADASVPLCAALCTCQASLTLPISPPIFPRCHTPMFPMYQRMMLSICQPQTPQTELLDHLWAAALQKRTAVGFPLSAIAPPLRTLLLCALSHLPRAAHTPPPELLTRLLASTTPSDPELRALCVYTNKWATEETIASSLAVSAARAASGCAISLRTWLWLAKAAASRGGRVASQVTPELVGWIAQPPPAATQPE